MTLSDARPRASRGHSWTRIAARSTSASDSAAAPDKALSAEVIGGRYQLLNELGRGGEGTVYRTLDRLTGRVVTLKRLHVPAREDDADELRLTLAQEFRLLASLRHPNIISVLDYGFDEERQPYFTMELARERLDRSSRRARTSRSRSRWSLLVQMLRALAYLHRRGDPALRSQARATCWSSAGR